MRFSKLARLILLPLIGMTLSGARCGPGLEPINYSVTSLTLDGPGSIANGSSATYTVTFTIDRPGPVSPNPRVLLLEEDSWFRDGDDLLSWTDGAVPSGQSTVTRTLTLSCTANKVRGTATTRPGGGSNNPNSGEGGRNPAEVYAKAANVESSTMDVTCR
ncbi:MAG: hypothetical protein ACE5IP_00150 [Terriglobia bacterium]